VQEKAFRCLLVVDSREISKSPMAPQTEDTPIYLEGWNKAITYFGPCHENGNVLLNQIVEAFKHEWFHGNLDSSGTEAALKGKPAGSYLVRYSTSPRCFTISLKQQNRNVKQFRITRDKDDHFVFNGKPYSSLAQLIDTNKNKIGLEKPCPGTPYVLTSNYDPHLLYSNSVED